MVAGCRDVVGNLTELESEDIQIEALMMQACEPVIQTFCHEVADNQINTGDLMECLVQNKHRKDGRIKEMNEKCSVGVTHFQRIQIKDFRFSYKFKTACKEDVLKLCPNIKKKVDVVICLSTTVRNDTLQDAKEQRVSIKCRKQLRVEEVEMSEDIRLEPELYDPCRQDINRLCQNVPFGNAQVIECLKENKRQLTQRCHQRIFKLNHPDHPEHGLQAEPGAEEGLQSRHPQVLPAHPEQGHGGQRAGGAGHRLPQAEIRRPAFVSRLRGSDPGHPLPFPL
ncbi:Golgi apparatus protein 1-like [Gasterosteus aculeatus]